MSIKSLNGGVVTAPTTPRSTAEILAGLVRPKFVTDDPDSEAMELAQQEVRDLDNRATEFTKKVVNKPTVEQFNI